jgi:S-DNA-T family DNA segregation ATPase FtsK/SpoIIIE
MAKKKQKKTKPSSPLMPQLTPVRGLILFSLAFGLILSLFSFAYGHPVQNGLGLIGYKLGWFFHALFGLGSYIFCIFLGWIGWRILFNKPMNHLFAKTVFIFIFTFSLTLLLSVVEYRFSVTTGLLRQFFYPALLGNKLKYHLGGALSYYLYADVPLYNLHRIFGSLGVSLIFLCTLFASFIFLAKIHPIQILNSLKNRWNQLKGFTSKFPIGPLENKDENLIQDKSKQDPQRLVKLRIPNNTPSLPIEAQPPPTHLQVDMLAIQPEMNLKVRPSISRKEGNEREGSIPFAGAGESRAQAKSPLPAKESDKATVSSKRESALAAQKVHNGDFTGYRLPPEALLTVPKKIDQNSLKKDLKKQAEVLEETLQSFGIEAKVGQINCGPTISSFEVHPAIGVKVQKIKTLENDIALNMEAKSIRIIAPIPGKAAVGIEVPNSQPQEVAFLDLLQAYQQSPRKFHIPILLGKAVNGDNVMSDLTKMPHCIIAGATGSGKSVCINTIVISIVMNAKPDEIKLVMVDPKKVELTPYSKLPHMLAPVITEPQGACAALNWLVKEMERRYELLKLTGHRNIEAFNTRKIHKEAEESLGREIPSKMPYIVGIIDELADLMMVASHDIETPIARIAQMARAVGIHLILATQRPSREVITGLIKANFPTRISFKVASRVNSQIVLDEIGAETLLGNGDMLFLPPGSSHLVRAQGAFIRDEDINAVIKYICDQAPPNYIIESFDRAPPSDDPNDNTEEDPGDSLYSSALDIVLSTGNASTTFLQRKLKIGYARAASLMDMLETRGIVGPAEGSKPRQILASRAAVAEAKAELSDDFDNEEE